MFKPRIYGGYGKVFTGIPHSDEMSRCMMAAGCPSVELKVLFARPLRNLLSFVQTAEEVGRKRLSLLQQQQQEAFIPHLGMVGGCRLGGAAAAGGNS